MKVHLTSAPRPAAAAAGVAPVAAAWLAGLMMLAWGTGHAPAARQAAAQPGESGRVLVAVNGRPITQGELDFLMVSRGVPLERRPALRRTFLEQLVDQRLMQAFLAERRAEASPLELEAEVRRIRELIERGGDRPEDVLARLGYTEQTLRDELALPLAWRTYARLLITPQRLREYFAKHRRQFDGTQVRGSQVFLKARTDAEREAALETLRGLREQIVASRLTFAEAARQHSQAPSAPVGGDVGWFTWRAPMPAEFSRVAFGLKPNEVSEPFTTSFGAHLVTVTDERPGELSLEDVRREVFAAFSDELWEEIVRKQREAVRIEWKVELDAPSRSNTSRG